MYFWLIIWGYFVIRVYNAVDSLILAILIVTVPAAGVLYGIGKTIETITSVYSSYEKECSDVNVKYSKVCTSDSKSVACNTNTLAIQILACEKIRDKKWEERIDFVFGFNWLYQSNTFQNLNL